jgi:signal transduction histidine kinase/DNA-binding response OmpR family regulator
MYEVTPNVDGREITHLSFKFPFEDGSGNRFVGGVAIDVTEQRRAETELQRQFREAERARSETTAILDATAEAMMLIAPDGRVATLNHRAFELLGLDPSKTLGQPIDLVRPYLERIFDDSGRVTALIADRVAMDSVVHTEIVSQRWPEARELALSSAPVQGGDGEPLGHLFAFRDVTRERAVDRMKTEFVSLVSHELRTPLTSIKGYVDLLLDGEVGDLEPDQKEFLAIVRNNAQRLVALINDLLDISRIESGKIELRPTAVDLARLIEGATMAMRPQLDGKRQRLIVSVADNLPSIWGDADRVAQVLTNLVSNAHKYTPVNGAIRIAAECQGHQVRVDVQDTGIGLSAEEQSQLFTKFFRAENRATQEVGGTGLGLVITRSLVEMHGGTMEVVSAPGKGATFSFTLPIARRETAELTPISRAGAHGGRVLVVEDEPDIAHLIRRYLSRDGYEVLLAHNAADARRLARLERPDLITLDIMLPDANGFTLLEWLKSEEATRDIPVMLLSMLPDDNRGLVLGAVDYMVKPVQEQTLLDKVATILSGNRRLVLVADDDADTREMLCRHLKHVGCDVIEASNGEEAVAQARRHHPTLLVIDVRMPGLDGVEAVRELREDPETRDLPVIVMTGSPGVAENGADIVAQLGINRLLMKPFSAKELSASIAQGLKPVGFGVE